MIIPLWLFVLLFCVGNDTFALLNSPQLAPKTRRHARHASDQCNNFLESPFSFCSVAGYNETFKFPAVLSGVKLQRAAKVIAANIFKNACSNSGQSGQVLAMTMRCSFFLPQCSNGERVYPCKRVCNEFLKQCEKGIPEFWFDFIVASCHVLPDEASSSGKCHEPPNFSVAIANDSNKGG